MNREQALEHYKKFTIEQCPTITEDEFDILSTFVLSCACDPQSAKRVSYIRAARALKFKLGDTK